MSAARVTEVERRLHALRHREPLVPSDVDLAHARLVDARGQLEFAVWRAGQSAASAGDALRRAKRRMGAAATARDRALAEIPDRFDPLEAAGPPHAAVPRLDKASTCNSGKADLDPLEVASPSWLDEPASGTGDRPAAWFEEGYVHECCFFSSTGDLTDVVGPPLRRAAARNELLVLSCSEGNNLTLSEALGPDIRVAMLSLEEGHRSAVAVLSWYRDILRTYGQERAARIRLVVEPRFDTGPDGWDEWRRFESLCNLLFVRFAVSQMCVYDLRVVPKPVLATAELSHPYVRSEGVRAPNPLFADPEELRRLSDPLDSSAIGLTPGEVYRDVQRISDVGTPLTVLLRARRMSVRSVEDLVTALGEVTSLLVSAWGGPVTIRVWTPPRGVVCAVAPQAPGFADDSGASDAVELFDAMMRTRLGAKLAQRLSDELTTVRGSEGFSVRLSKRR